MDAVAKFWADLQELAPKVRETFGTPTFVYSQEVLEHQAREALSFRVPFGFTLLYALKANPSMTLVKLLARLGLRFDASSVYEVFRLEDAGIKPERVSLTSQQLPTELELRVFVSEGMQFNACSALQLETFGQLFPGRNVGLRVNPGLGSGHNNRTNVGGLASSFGVWHENLEEIERIREKYSLHINRIHSHIGSGGDPEVWERCARLTLGIAARFPEVYNLNLGGGLKVGRMPGEESADIAKIGDSIAAELRRFADEHGGRRLHLELEPGTFLVANAGGLVASVTDVVNTGPLGYKFIKLNTGMTEILRPSHYGAQHPIAVVPVVGNGKRDLEEYLVVGHCCESGDILTPAPGNPEGLAPRLLPEAKPGDLAVIGGAGAYCAGMSSKNYCSFPEAAEVLLAKDGTLHLIRRRQALAQITENEIPVELYRLAI